MIVSTYKAIKKERSGDHSFRIFDDTCHRSLDTASLSSMKFGQADSLGPTRDDPSIRPANSRASWNTTSFPRHEVTPFDTPAATQDRRDEG